MDGVVADFTSGIISVAPELTMLPENYELEEQAVNDIVAADNYFFQNLPPIKDSIESVLKLMDHYMVIFCSTPMETVPHSFTGKKEWLNKHFGEKAYKNLKLTHHKNLVIGDYLIDDRIKNGVDKFTGEHIHFGTEKFPNWDSVLKYLL